MDRPRAHVPHLHADDSLECRSRGGSQHRHLTPPRHPQVLQGEADDSRKSLAPDSSFGFMIGLTVPSCESGEDTWDGYMEADLRRP